MAAWAPPITIRRSAAGLYATRLSASSDLALALLQLVEKWKVINSARRSEGVIGYHQALRGRAPRREEEALPKAEPVRPSKLDNNIVKTGSDLLLKLYDNGYVRAKMIRIRLLHYWICKLLGRQTAVGSFSTPCETQEAGQSHCQICACA